MGERLNRHEQAQFAFEGFLENVGSAALRDVFANTDKRMEHGADPAFYDFAEKGDDDPDNPFVTTVTADSTRVNLVLGMEGVVHSLDRSEVEIMMAAHELVQKQATEAQQPQK